MQSTDDALPGQWSDGHAHGSFDSSASTPPVMSATSGPIPVDEYFYPADPTPPALSPSDTFAPPSVLSPPTPTGRAASQSPARQRSTPTVPATHTISAAKSTPVLVPSGSVKDLAHRFNQAGAANGAAWPPQLTIRTNADKYRRPGVSKNSAHVSPKSPTKSPTKDGPRKLQKSRAGRPRSPTKSPMTSFDTSASFGSTTTIASAASQPQMTFSPKKQMAGNDVGPYFTSRPLFGEITSDGRWNGNFDIGSYGQLPTFSGVHRRSSDGTAALSRGRSQSHQDILQPASATALYPPQSKTLSHKRSRSEMDALQESRLQSAQGRSTLNTYPTPPDSGPRNLTPASRIPVPNRGLSREQTSAHPRLNPSPARNRLSKSPTRNPLMNSNENANPVTTPRHRYHPPPLPSDGSAQTLSAKIVAPPPKLSPQLRSSRPRQPVSQATTSASRARAAEHFPSSVASRDGRTPSEQWLGRPYDPKGERSKRKIPELGKINFEERRQRIAKAISQNLEETRSLESLREKSRSRQAMREIEAAESGAENPLREDNNVTDEPNKTDSVPGGWPTPGGLTVDTFQIPGHSLREAEPMTASTERTAATEFEFDESPILGKQAVPDEPPILLTSATYQPPSSRSNQLAITPNDNVDTLPSPSVLDNVMRMRERSRSRNGKSDDEEDCDDDDVDDDVPAPDVDGHNKLSDPWNLDQPGQGLQSVQGSIKIMLDDPWAAGNRAEDFSYPGSEQYQHEHATDADGHYADSPLEDEDADYVAGGMQDTPRRQQARQDTLRASDYQHGEEDSGMNGAVESENEVARLLRHYKSTGTITAEMVEHVQKHMLDLQRVSANEGSNGFMIQSLLDSVINSQQEPREMEQVSHSQSFSPEIPEVTPDTPLGWEFSEHSGTALVYTSEPSNEEDADQTPEEEEEDDDEFHIKIRRADEEWERQQRESYLRLGAGENEDRPHPPPKDSGYTLRSSVGAEGKTTLPPDFAEGLRISTAGYFDTPGFPSLGDTMEQPKSALSSSAPQRSSFAPPPLPPPSASATNLPFGMPEVPPIPAAYSERNSSEMSPRVRKNLWGPPSGSSRPSVDSQRAAGAPVLPASVSVTSFSESTRQNSMDVGPDGQPKQPPTSSQTPEQKRLLKRRHIIKELLDTENTYHQDLKIIEDIYRATAVADVISADDKKTLFSNCDEVERFSLQFYDELRKAAASVYVPAKKGWSNKRGSFSTTQSEGNGQLPDSADDEKDRATTIGQAFQRHLQRMEQVYSVYLRNHEAANQRLSALRNSPTVKCWLDECHNNANDITTAWDLDSLLVKPTQRVAKYPMFLHQLLESAPSDHPDREALVSAAKDSVSMLTRINDAKKRADLVDQIVNRKRKESDVRSGIAKAFGRRTEKLKERVGIAEAFQDAEYDELAHKFGGHFIRLQICMRDVQDYMNRIEKAVSQINYYALALDFFADVSISPIPELESKWRRYGQAIRDLISIAFTEHKAAVNKRVIGPIVNCIKLHEGPQNAINDRKKRIVDYAKCKALEKRGEKPDKRTVEAADLYMALNDQLKIELPKLYSLTATLVQACLNCFLDIQLTWYNTWERKLRPVLEAADIPSSIQQIEPAFRPDYDMVKGQLLALGICNGSLLADSANFLSPVSTSDDAASRKRPSTLDSGKRTMSISSETSPIPGSASHKRQSSGYIPGLDALPFPYDGRIRSNSAQSNRTPSQTPGSANNRWWSAGIASPSSLPSTANQPPSYSTPNIIPRISADQPRPLSGATYFTARAEQPEDHRFSNIFTSALPQEDAAAPRDGSSPKPPAPDDMPVLFVCASLFEFSIDKTRREAGYPYLTYVQGEVFDVIAQKGELWLAKNQDDGSNSLGWIWEQHFVILSQD